MSAGLNVIPNPFAEISRKPSWFRPYRSTREKRLVWVKGTMSEVPPLGDHVIERWKFDTVVHIVMSQRTLPLSLAGLSLTSADHFSVVADMSITCEPHDSEAALKNLAVYFAESVENLEVLAGSHLRAECARTAGEFIAGQKSEFVEKVADSLAKVLSAAGPLYVERVHLALACPEVETAAREKRAAELAAPTERVRHALALAKLADEIEIQRKKFEQQQDEARARGESEAQALAARVASLEGIAKLCSEAKIAALRDNPQAADAALRLEEARLKVQEAAVSGDLRAHKAAMQEALEMVRAVAESSRAVAGGGATVINNRA